MSGSGQRPLGAAALESIRLRAVAIAEEAGQVLLEGWEQRPAVQAKGAAIDLVTEYDGRAERLVVERLRAAFPDHAIVGEEGTRIGGRGDADELVWYVDPLDGTTNFAHGLPLFAVSIGLCAGTEPLVGVVLAPAVGWTFSGAVPGVALRNGRPIRPSAIPVLAQGLVVTGFPYDGTLPHSNLPEYTALGAASHGARRLGSAALDLCFVACGWMEAYWERYIKPWDMAAGAAIVRAAGGRVTDLDLSPWDGATGRILATNGQPGVHEEASRLLAQVARETGTPWP